MKQDADRFVDQLAYQWMTTIGQAIHRILMAQRASTEYNCPAVRSCRQCNADLELSEVWSFVGHKHNPVYVWVDLCRSTRQVDAVVTDDLSAATWWRLWIAIPLAYRRGFCFTDFWQAYAAVIPDSQHITSGKQIGNTAYIEGWNNTLRQRVGRFARKTLSFSKCPIMHWICLQLFLHRYNLETAIRRG